MALFHVLAAATMNNNDTLYLIATGFAVVVLVGVLIMRYLHNRSLAKHYIMADLKLRKLSPASPTRKRLTVAKQLFDKGWKVRIAESGETSAVICGLAYLACLARW